MPNQPQPLFIHLRRYNHTTMEMSPLGGVTLAAVDDGQGGVRVGLAVCHERDHFVKKEGRNRALGRMLSTSPQHEKFRAQFSDLTVDEFGELMHGNPPKRAELIPQMQAVLDRAGATSLMQGRR